MKQKGLIIESYKNVITFNEVRNSKKSKYVDNKVTKFPELNPKNKITLPVKHKALNIIPAQKSIPNPIAPIPSPHLITHINP